MLNSLKRGAQFLSRRFAKACYDGYLVLNSKNVIVLYPILMQMRRIVPNRRASYAIIEIIAHIADETRGFRALFVEVRLLHI